MLNELNILYELHEITHAVIFEMFSKSEINFRVSLV